MVKQLGQGHIASDQGRQHLKSGSSASICGITTILWEVVVLNRKTQNICVLKPNSFFLGFLITNFVQGSQVVLSHFSLVALP